MKPPRWIAAAFFIVVASAFSMGGCAEDAKDCPTPQPIGDLEAVGSDACRSCHDNDDSRLGVWDDFMNSGHPHKLNAVINGEKPDDPTLELPDDLSPAGIAWGDVAYVIGGYGWKARFILKTGKPGNIHTGNIAQYNLDPPSGASPWVAYEASNPDKPYTCGTCHATGWLTYAENGNVHQDGLAGIMGTWDEPGIRCERCHGPGSRHVASGGDPTLININRSSDLCGECHMRDPNHKPLAKGGFIEHHEQYDEMLSAGHAASLCTTCHDPHRGVKKDDPDGSGIRVACETCHTDEAAHLSHIPGPRCIDCHMPYVSKTAVAHNVYKADLRTHIFKIRATTDTRQTMFVTEGSETFVPHGYGVTLDFVCYQCHKDEQQVGGSASVKSMAELAARARGIHSNKAFATVD